MAEKQERNFRKVRRGYVVSEAMDKTITVELEQRSTHPLYGKVVRSTRKVKAHDEHNEAHVGDLVSIMETRPLSKTKRWRLDKGARGEPARLRRINDSAGNAASCRRQHGCQGNLGHPSARRIEATLCRHRRHHRRHRQGRHSWRVGQEGRRGQGRCRPHRQGAPSR